MPDLDGKIQELQEIIGITPLDHPDQARRLQDLGMAYAARYEKTGAIGDLQTSIKHCQDSLDITPVDHPDRLAHLHNLGISYGVRYRRSGATADIERSMQQFQEFLELIPTDHRDRARPIQNLGGAYHDRYNKTGAVEDLQMSIKLYHEALNMTPKDHPDRARRLRNIGLAYSASYRKNGAIQNLQSSIQHFQEALDITPQDHPDRARRLEDLGMASAAMVYSASQGKIGAIQDLQSSIQHFQEALDMTPPGHTDRARRLEKLGMTYIARHAKTGAMQDVQSSIHKFQEALDITPLDHPDRADQLHALGMAYKTRYKRTGEIEDLQLSIQHLQEALDMTPLDHPGRARRLEDLGSLYRARYERIGEIEDLQTSIQRFQDANDITPLDHPDRAGRLQDLGTAYGARYARFGAMADLQMCMQQLQDALNRTAVDHSVHSRLLVNLGLTHRLKYERTGAITELDTAIHYLQKSLYMTAEDHPSRPLRLHNLGLQYRRRYQESSTMADLQASIKLFQEALSMTPVDHPDRAGRLYGIGGTHHDAYVKTDAIENLHTSIQYYQEALELTPVDHPDRAQRLGNLGLAYKSKYQRSGRIEDQRSAILQYQEALNHSSSPTLRRLEPGLQLLELAIEIEDWSLAYRTASTAISLVPLLTPHSLETPDKQHLLTEVVGLASDAAAVALMVGKTPYEAIQLLELGRGVIMSALSDIRADVTDLRQKHPRLAEEYTALRDEIDTEKGLVTQFDRLDTTSLPKYEGKRRYDAGQKLDQIIRTIRGLPNFDRFLLGPSEEELIAAAASGPIVVINASNCRCDALIIEETGLRTLRLPQLGKSDIRAHAEALTRPELLNVEVLEWLWDALAEPVLHTLGFTEKPDGCWPRMWWVPTGPIVKLPIHAAGYHSRCSSDTVLDRVISSYCSSIKTLIQSRLDRDKTTVSRRPEKAVLIGMPELLYAPQEVNVLEGLCKSMDLHVCRPRPYRKDVISEIQDCDIFHFAGHGRTDPLDPLKSALVLSGERLTVGDLLEINLRRRKPFIAYLSACGTGQVKRNDLIDEGLHLINACQLAGFQHVIGTLWEVDDRACIDAATGTYQWILGQQMNERSVSEGVHNASRRLRAQWVAENVTRCASKSSTEVHNKGKVHISGERSLSSQPIIRDSRDVVECHDIPPYWVPFVHFGI